MAKRKPWPDATDDPAPGILRGLRDFAARVSDKPVPIPHLEDDLTRRTTERDDFELIKAEKVGGAHLIEVRWTKTGTYGDLHEAVLNLIAWAGHPAMYLEKSNDEAWIQYDVVSTTQRALDEYETHVLRVIIRGGGVTQLLRAR